MRPLSVVLALVLTLVLAAPAAGQEVLATLAEPTPIDAHGDTVAWSQPGPDGRYVLVTNHGPLPVEPRAVPFDVDLGTDGAGRLVATYSRCEREEGSFDFYGGLYSRQRGCDIYVYRFTGRTETRLAASSPAGDEVWPTMWRGEYAFARTYDRRRAYPYLYVRRGGRSIRVPGGQRRECHGRECSPDTRSFPIALDLYGRRLGFGWHFQGLNETASYDLRVHDVRGRARTVVHEFDGGGLTGLTLTFPAFENGRVHYLFGCYGDPSGCVGRVGVYRSSYLRPDPQRTPIADGVLLSHARAGGVTYLLRDRTFVGDCKGDPPEPAGTCELLALTG